MPVVGGTGVPLLLIGGGDQIIDNPDAASEQALLRAYAPSLEQSLLDSLTGAFAELRQLNEGGLIAYP